MGKVSLKGRSGEMAKREGLEKSFFGGVPVREKTTILV